ncbi:MAG: signal peptidase I [Armatimonadota bacterium]
MTRRYLVSLVFIVALLIGTYWVSRAIRLAVVPSKSMVPTLYPGDYLMVRKDAYKNADPRRGDIIVFREENGRDYWVKRIIGLPGETIGYWSGRVAINNRFVHEPYVRGQKIREAGRWYTLGGNEYFVMGDNRGHSNDSRDFGPITREQFIGRVHGIIYPIPRRTRFTNPFQEAR